MNGSRNLVAHYTANPQTYTISVSASPSSGGAPYVGNTPGATSGTYTSGQSCTVHANPNSGYTFTNWTENGNVVSTQANYTFTVNGNRTLVANFTYVPPTYTITVYANPTNGGTVTGGGTYNYGATVNLTANANSGFTFDHWQDGNTNNPRTITVTGNATYTAYFEAQPQAPVGAINGLFTINSYGDQVYFSKGNLQYKASTNTWRFATNQWDCVGGTDSNGNSYGNVSGSSNNNISQTYSGWIDLFGWGTSGYHDLTDPSNVNYQPWSTSTAFIDNPGYNWYGYGPSTNMPSPNLTGSSANYDWGVYNTVYSGNVTTSGWRTLTGGNNDNAEWYYVFNSRTTSSGILYAKANVDNVNGVILLPDDWSASYYSLNSPNTHNANYNSNIISASQWSALEQHGAVFLPAAGSRNETSVRNYLFGEGSYWSTSYGNESSAWDVNFSPWHIGFIGDDYGRPYGRSVRLVYPVN